ncbi:MAG: SDR family NAD(P)-dependent oxidoreductase [Planctomycetes bacterium]|nr:SDR family NAD(P)-dependent oxidoreductase [Planctomycetota bacterium]
MSHAPPQRPTALVTGASSGIGRAIAAALAAAGYAVVLAARGRDRLDVVADGLRAQGAEVLAATCDVRDAGAVEDLVRAAVARYGRLDVVVANAGVYARSPATSIGTADVEAALATNFWGAFHLVRAALPHLLARQAGHLVLMASFDARKTLPHDGAYAAAKAALACYAAALRQDLRPHGVHVCTVFPGRVDTPMVDGLMVPWISRKVAPERVARAVLGALRRRRAEVVVPWPCRLLLWADTLSPRLGDWLVRVLRLDGEARSR